MGGGAGVRDVIVTLFSLYVHSSSLGKEVKQERNLYTRKEKNNDKKRGGLKEELIRRIKQREEREKESSRKGKIKRKQEEQKERKGNKERRQGKGEEEN